VKRKQSQTPVRIDVIEVSLVTLDRRNQISNLDGLQREMWQLPTLLDIWVVSAWIVRLYACRGALWVAREG
jgi:hypothetical protein